jgi:hypothetical protein
MVTLFVLLVLGGLVVMVEEMLLKVALPPALCLLVLLSSVSLSSLLLSSPYTGLDSMALSAHMAGIKQYGFNCIRLPWNDVGFFGGEGTYLDSSNVCPGGGAAPHAVLPRGWVQCTLRYIP